MTAKPAHNTNTAQRRKILKIIAASPAIVLMTSKRAFAIDYAPYCSAEPDDDDLGGNDKKDHKWNGKGHGHHRSHGKGHDHHSGGGHDDKWEGYGKWDHDD